MRMMAHFLKNTRILILFFSIPFLVSCSKDLIQVPLDLVYFEAMESKDSKFPPFVQDLLSPRENVCSKEFTIGYNPVTIKRRDSGQEFAFEYLVNRQANQKKIKAVARQFRTYFEDTTLDSILTRTARMNNSFEEYLNANRSKDNVFFFSTNDELTDVDFTFYTSVPALNDAVSKSICSDSSQKVVVVMVPSSYKPGPVIPTSPSKDDSNTNSVSKIFKALINKGISKDERIAQIPGVLATYFTNSAMVEVFETNGTRLEPKPIAEYLESLVFLLSLDSIQIHQTFTDNQGKIDNIQITEHHKLNR